LLGSCREERALANPETQVIVPKSRTARERQDQAQSRFAALTDGAPARLVWVHDPSADTADTFAESDALHLMGWDTREGGPRKLVAKAGSFGRPLVTPDGRHVVYTEKRLQRRDGIRHLKPRIRVVDWETGAVRTLGHGFAVDTWAEPESGRVWVYALDRIHATRQLSVAGSTLVRFALDAPERRETVWTRTRLSVDNVQVSRDGRRFAGLFPWPDAGVGDFATGSWTKLDVGCWPALAPDDSYVAWVFDGPHRNLRLVAPGEAPRWTVNLSGGPDLRGKEAYHPRWSNHPQFLVFTGPYTKKKQGSRNAIASGGLSAEVFIAKFSADLRSLGTTVRMTHNKNGDFFPDLWVGGADHPVLAGFPQKPTSSDPAPAGWPPTPEGLVFVWRDLRAANEVPGAGARPACHLEARGIGRFTPQHGALLDGGWFEADDDSNAAIASAIRAGRGLTVQALVTEWPGAATEHATPLIGWLAADGTPALRLERLGPDLRVIVGQGESRVYGIVPHPLVPCRPTAVALVWKDGALRWAIDGAWQGEPIPLPADLVTQWPDGRLVLGQPLAGTPRPGTSTAIERLTIHSRPLVPAELAARAATDLDAARGRVSPPRLRVRARVLEATTPDLDSLDTYHRLLVDHTYEVTAVLEGAVDAKKIAVLHWAALDDRAVPGYPRAVGSEVELELEPHPDHPELQGELTDLGSEEFGLPLFLDVATPVAP
jgi:hypothetical protein